MGLVEGPLIQRAGGHGGQWALAYILSPPAACQCTSSFYIIKCCPHSPLVIAQVLRAVKSNTIDHDEGWKKGQNTFMAALAPAARLMQHVRQLIYA